MDEFPFSEAGVEFDRANAARMYDYFLGGAHHFAVDREHAALLLAANPEMATLARANRSYLGRLVRRCLERGVTQFLDLGSGVPTVGNVHEIALAAEPDARVAYVDVEPVAVAHGQEIVADLDTVTATRADLRDPEAVLAAPGVAGLLDFTRPVALLAVSCLHFVGDEVYAVMDRYRESLAPGSVIGVSHVSDDVPEPAVADRMRAMAEAFAGSANQPILRSRAEIAALLGDYAPIGDGVVDISGWPAAGGAVTGGLAAAGVHPA